MKRSENGKKSEADQSETRYLHVPPNERKGGGRKLFALLGLHRCRTEPSRVLNDLHSLDLVLCFGGFGQ